MRFYTDKKSLRAKSHNETIFIEAWGENSLRVRVTHNSDFTGDNHALEYVKSTAEINIGDNAATIANGKISCAVAQNGWLEFFKDGQSILKEYARDWRGLNEHSPSMKFSARDFKAVSGNDYDITMRFEADRKEKIFGMGQYQQPNLNLKGCILELA